MENCAIIAAERKLGHKKGDFLGLYSGKWERFPKPFFNRGSQAAA
jgi:hypothetical protein